MKPIDEISKKAFELYKFNFFDGEDKEFKVQKMCKIAGFIDGYEIAMRDKKDNQFTLEDMRNFAKKCCLLWNEENEISYPELVDLEIKKLTNK